MQEKKIKPKRRINLKKIIVFGLGIYFLTLALVSFINTPISNIFIKNNKFLSDQEIIDIAKINNYPSAFKSMDMMIKKRLEDNIYIKKAHVYKKNFTEVYIVVIENAPMFINKALNKTILQDGTSVSKIYTLPTLINYVPDKIYDRLIKEFANIDYDILMHISEIEYRPNSVDDGRFLLSMTDANYVYVTLTDFDVINDYLDIVKNFGTKKGILYLDSGEYFEIIER